jgi:hypothetical protein
MHYSFEEDPRWWVSRPRSCACHIYLRLPHPRVPQDRWRWISLYQIYKKQKAIGTAVIKKDNRGIQMRSVQRLGYVTKTWSNLFWSDSLPFPSFLTSFYSFYLKKGSTRWKTPEGSSNAVLLITWCQFLFNSSSIPWGQSFFFSFKRLIIYVEVYCTQILFCQETIASEQDSFFSFSGLFWHKDPFEEKLKAQD